jgi:hypothetical protein
MKSLYCVLTIDTDDEEDLYEASFAIGSALQDFNPHINKDLLCSLDPIGPEELADLQASSKKCFETGKPDLVDGADHFLALGDGMWADITPETNVPHQHDYEKGSC